MWTYNTYQLTNILFSSKKIPISSYLFLPRFTSQYHQKHYSPSESSQNHCCIIKCSTSFFLPTPHYIYTQSLYFHYYQTIHSKVLLKRVKMETHLKNMPKNNAFVRNLIILLVLSIIVLKSLSTSPNFYLYLAIFLPIIFYFVHSLSSPHAQNVQNTPPGPLTFPIVGNWLQVGNDLNHRRLATLSKSYGPVFLLKLGVRNLVVVSNPELACEVLHAQGVEFGSRPRNLVFDIFTGSGQDMVFTVYGDHWRKMRRIMTVPFFTNKVVNTYSLMWEEEMEKVVSDLKRNDNIIGIQARNEGFVIRKRLQLMLYNIMYRMMFDEGFESMEDPMFKEATKFNSERSRLAQSFEYNYGDFIPLLRPFLRSYLSDCTDLQKRRLAFFNDYYVQKRRKIMAANGENHKISCAIDHIIDAQKKGELSEENVLYIVENINVAAIETTLWSMEWAIAEVVNHPKIQQKIRDEIATKLKGEPVTEANLEQLPYLQATIKETLRLHTPIPLLVPHMNLEEAKLGGYTIPRESKVVVNAWWLANNPEWWRDPQEFRPERFLEEEGAADVTVGGGKVDFRYLPFGVGRRSCPGIILALPILGLIIAKLVTNFDMKPPKGEEKIDVSEKGGQFSLHIAKHSTVLFSPI